ncbi:YncE family protein [Celeribacter persicus]|uniref:Lactonase family protein with 7-bladed beta-propeller n=1 Tax=Celeribacter persicus TaxID=1651082 RepID=A0A2T5HLU0_9RHOB|nr:hypothetical protein [Celeribacter persicus]PTQ72506.1 hypothetical protein C8N42_10615 [Celeribacter persicus]
MKGENFARWQVLAQNALDFEELDAAGAILVPRMSDDIAAELTRLGRTEDIRLSPSGRRMAVAGYLANSCLLFECDWGDEAQPVLTLMGATEISSPDLAEPHGFDFIGEDLLIVGNRRGGLTLFDLPAARMGVHRCVARPRRKIVRASLRRQLRAPGSVVVSDVQDDTVEVIACNNYRHRLSRHRFSRRWRLPSRNGIAYAAGMNVPDGIALSPDRRFLAVSSHGTHEVLIYPYDRRNDPKRPPVGRLGGMCYPHGLRFSPDGTRLYVADAGAPLIHVFDAAEANWSIEAEPVQRFCPVTEAEFRAGHVNEAEGGMKGMELACHGRLLLATCEETPLRVFDLEKLPF